MRKLKNRLKSPVKKDEKFYEQVMKTTKSQEDI